MRVKDHFTQEWLHPTHFRRAKRPPFCLSRVWRIAVEREEECRAFTHFRFRPDASAVALDDTLHNGQADTSALESVSGVETLKDTEEFFSTLRVEARTVAPDKTSMSWLICLAPVRTLFRRSLASGATPPRTLQATRMKSRQPRARERANHGTPNRRRIRVLYSRLRALS